MVNSKFQSADVFDYIANKCEQFSVALENHEQGQLENENLEAWLQNLCALGYGDDVILDFLNLNGEYSEGIPEWLEEKLEKWRDGNYKCYGCQKIGCSEEEITNCQGKCKKDMDGRITNNIYNVADVKAFEAHLECNEAEERLEEVLNKVSDGNKDAAFTEQALHDFGIVSKANPELFKDFMEELEEKKVDIKKLKKNLSSSNNRSNNAKYVALNSENANELLKRFVGYQSASDVLLGDNGWIFYYDGTAKMELPVCNFIPEITKKFVYDDDVETVRNVALRLIVDGTKVTDEVVIPATELKVDKTIYKYFGDVAIIYSHFDLIRICATELAKSVPTTTINYSLGWKKSEITGKYAYCFSGTAIGDDTVIVADIRELPGYNELNSKPISSQEAFEAYLEMENLMQFKPGAMRVLCTYTTGSILVTKLMELGIPPKYLIWLYGITGSFKTEIAKCLCCFFGKLENPASTFLDTKAAMEKKLHLCKDALLLVDDFCPSASHAEERVKVDKANMVTRNIGDRVSRGRAKSNMSLSKEYRPRGNVLITGEDIIGGVSTLARNLAIPISRGDVTSDALTSVQNKKEHLNAFMKYYIQYVKEHVMDQCDFDLEKLFLDFRTEFQDKKNHRRLAETAANLRLSQHVFNHFLLHSGLITEEIFTEREDFMKNELGKFIEQQNELIINEDPCDLFMRALSEMIVSNEMTPTSAKKPEHLHSNKSIVFFEGDYYYFLPSATYAKVVEYYKRKDKNFVLSERGVWNTLCEREILEINPSSDGHAPYKILKTIGKRTARVIVIKKSVVESY